MRARGPALLSGAIAALLFAASSVAGGQARPRFLVTIKGTQHLEWTLEDTGDCSFKGHGEQSETFGTSRPVKVIAPPARRGLDQYEREFRAFNGRGWGRVVPLSGRETRVYRVLKAPTGACEDVGPEFRSDCRGTNPLLPRAGVVLMRDGRKMALHVPVDTPWIARRPSTCDIRLFDLRNSYLAAVFGLLTYKPVTGGTFENRRAKTLRFSVGVRYCVDPSESYFEIELRKTCRPPRPGYRGAVLTGELTASWTVIFGRTR